MANLIKSIVNGSRRKVPVDVFVMFHSFLGTSLVYLKFDQENNLLMYFSKVSRKILTALCLRHVLHIQQISCPASQLDEQCFCWLNGELQSFLTLAQPVELWNYSSSLLHVFHSKVKGLDLIILMIQAKIPNSSSLC